MSPFLMRPASRLWCMAVGMVAAGIPLACFWLWHILAGHSIAAALEEERHRQERMRPVYEWIAAYVPREATILAYDDTAVYLYAGRHARGMHLPTKLFGDETATARYYSAIGEHARRGGLDYLLTTERDFHRENSPALIEVLHRAAADKSLFEPVYVSPAANVYRVAPARGRQSGGQ